MCIATASNSIKCPLSPMFYPLKLTVTKLAFDEIFRHRQNWKVVEHFTGRPSRIHELV